MSTASPPSPPLKSPPPGPPVRPVVAPGPAQRFARPLALGALALVVLIVAYLLFAGGGGADYQLVFPEADQLVKGDQVQVGGVPVGSIKNIVLTPDFKARVTIHVDSSLTPLHAGTSAEIRVPSLSGVANRYIALAPGPNNAPTLSAGSQLPAGAVHGAVDLDQLFNIFNARTRKGLQNVVQGSAEQYAGASADVNVASKYLAPSFAATDHLFAELVRDQHTLTEFLVKSARALTTIAAHKDELTSLVSNADTTFQAIGSQQASLASGLQQLPVLLHQGNQTFAELPSTLSALRKLVDVSKPNTKTLAPFFAALRPLLSEATPVVHDLSLAVSQPGANNDFTDVARALPALAQSLQTASPNAIKGLQESVPITAFFGPYAPDLEGLVRDFGQGAAYYDANGHYARVNPLFDNFTLDSEGKLTPTTPQQGLQNLTLHQLRRCPGAAATPPADGSAPFAGSGQFSCDPSEVP